MRNQSVSVGELRRILQLETKYKEFRELNKFVIKVAVNEINEKSDLLLSIEPIKQGRKVVALEFKVAKKAKASIVKKMDSSRIIYGVFEEKNRPQVVRNSLAEGDWAAENYNRAIKQMREDGILNTRFIDDDLPNIPTNWLKVIKKYASIINRSLSRDITEELEKRN